jgi:transposase
MKDKVTVRPFRPHEKKKLRRLKNQRGNVVNNRNARIVLLSRGARRNRDIAELVDCSPQWVRIIIHRFNDGGLEAITWYPWFLARTPYKFLAEAREQIAEVALSSPKSLIGMQQWSLPKLRDYLVAQKIVSNISIEWLRQILRRCGVSLRRTKTWKESNDPDFWRKYRAIRRLYKRPRPANGRRLCIDEFGPLNLQPRHGQCRMGRGKGVERLRATYSRKLGVRHFLAYYDLETKRLYGRFTRRKTWVEFLSFLKWVRNRYPREQVLHIVMDNYGPHLKAEVQIWAKANNIRCYFTPTDASWLNRIECQFTALKKFALENSDHRSHEEQQKAIESYLSWRNGRREISLQSWKTYKRNTNKMKMLPNAKVAA